MASKGGAANPGDVVIKVEEQPGSSGGGGGDPLADEGERAEGEEGEEEIKGEPRTFQQKAAAHNINVAQFQVEEVIDIMRTNVDKVLERDNKLGELEQRADTLYEGASAFQKSAGSLKNKMWLQNMKQTIIMIILGLVLLAAGAKYLGLI